MVIIFAISASLLPLPQTYSCLVKFVVFIGLKVKEDHEGIRVHGATILQFQKPGIF